MILEDMHKLASKWQLEMLMDQQHGLLRENARSEAILALYDTQKQFNWHLLEFRSTELPVGCKSACPALALLGVAHVVVTFTFTSLKQREWVSEGIPIRESAN